MTSSIATRRIEFLEGARLALYAVLIVASLLLQDGRTVFALSAAAMVLALALHLLSKPVFFRLVMVWQVSYLIVVAREGFFNQSNIVSLISYQIYDDVARYVSAGNAAFLLGHGLLFREGEFRSPKVRDNTVKKTSLTALGYVSVLYALYLATSVPAALTTALSGRFSLEATSELTVNPVGGVLSNAIVNSVGIALPAMIAFLALGLRRKRRYLMFAATIPVLLLLFLQGTRFHLLFGFAGLAVLLVSRVRLSFSVTMKLTIAAGVLFLSSIVMARFRNVGLSSESVDGMFEDDAPAMHYEGVIVTLGQAMQYFRMHDHMLGASQGIILVFWVPRALWATKPTLIGYWLPREMGLTGVSGGFSAAGTFAIDPFADFGFAGGLINVFMHGLLFGLLDRWAGRQLVTSSPTSIVSAVLFGGTFFAVRSYDTTIIAMCGVAACIYPLHWFLLRNRARASVPGLSNFREGRRPSIGGASANLGRTSGRAASTPCHAGEKSASEQDRLT